MRMTVAMVRQFVGQIDRYKEDPETAHMEEDHLYRDVLEAIAKGECEDPAACAQEALKTQHIRFSRWYA